MVERLPRKGEGCWFESNYYRCVRHKPKTLCEISLVVKWELAKF